MSSRPMPTEEAREMYKGQMGHIPMVGPKVVKNITRPSPELLKKFENVFVPDLSDRVGALYTMDSSIRSLYQPAPRLVGSAVTVKIPPGDTLSIHYAFRMLQKGDVLVVDARGDTESCGSGGGSPMPAISRGLAGIVIDGAWRDIQEFEAIGFPIYGKAISPFSSPKSRPGEINVPVCVGGVIVHPGDIVVCDREGGVVVPQEYAEIVAETVKDFELRESLDEWDIDRIDRTSDERAEYFDRIFRARGGKYIE